MNLKTIAVIVSLTAVCAPALAQSSFFSEVMEVRVTNVDVIVTGKGGKPVPGLTLEDFELYENGVKKDITNFLEIREDAAPALTAAGTSPEATATTAATAVVPEDTRRRQIVVFFDNAAIKPFHRATLYPFLDRFVKENVRKGDELSVITWERSLKAELDPTGDQAAMAATLKRLSVERANGLPTGSDLEHFRDQIMFVVRSYQGAGRVPPWNEAIATARSYAMSASQVTRQRVEALKSVVRSMRGAPGRKILVFVTENLSTNPAEGAFAFLDSVKDLFEGVDTPAMSYARDFEIVGLTRDVADAANSSGVTLYPIDLGGKFGDSEFGDASTNRIITSAPMVITPTANITVSTIAAETGGVALYGSTNWKLAFDTISSDLGTYYSLGYRSEGDKKDQLRNVEVRLKSRQRYAVRMRHAVIEPSASSEMTDAVSAHLFRAVSGNDLAIRVSAGTAAPGESESVTIPVTVVIPTEKLTLLPDGTDLTGSFAVFAAFVRKDGAVSKVARQPQSFRFPAESLNRRKEITVKIDVKADARTEGISVGVMDEASRATGFAAVKLTE
jgi:VWFA-related protein